ncbi:hypothetical protein [Ornithinicoccus hortensis]|uniref:Uncharacterized protein n=1 Tax=Ornithinicoccus hortensis TaxID=82346 RepID=A0A542YLX3_9MICO|nr:hypothetical protein [Ornithinicoccus hortensis]TQL49096.1 hypothetical protein FB467_0161 [Ornithinicoccus hortensis]
MTTTGHPDHDLILDLALGGSADATGQAAAHLADCARCRRDYQDLADAVAHVLPAVPRVAPPPDFLPGVVAALHTPGGRTPAVVAPAADRRWRVWPTVAAGLLGLVAGAAITVGVTADPAPPAGAPVAVTEPPGALRTADGGLVGRVAPSRAAGKEVLVVEVTDGPPGARYTCRLVLSDGSTQDVGSWTLDGAGPQSWVVPVPAQPVETVELVAESGRVWSSATP